MRPISVLPNGPAAASLNSVVDAQSGALPPSTGAANPCDSCQTRGVCIASRLPGQSLLHLPGWMQISQVLPTGTCLYRAGETAGRQFHVRSGMFKTTVVNADGDEFITGFHMPGDVIGSVSANDTYVESAVALDTATVCELRLDNLLEKKTNNQVELQLVHALVLHQADNNRHHLAHRLILSQTTAQVRFAAYCVVYAQKLAALGRDEAFLPTPMSRTDLANYLGMTLESLSRVISKLNGQRVIHAARDHIDIKQMSVLRTLAKHALL